MANYNRVILMGNLTRDPQLRYLPSNTPVCEFGMAINRRYRSQDGNQREETCFVDITAFGRQAENINQYMAKGRPILVEGRLRYESWTSQDGQRRSKLVVVAENSQFIGGRSGDSGGSSSNQGGHSRNQSPAAEQSSGHTYDPDSGPPSDDNIPF